MGAAANWTEHEMSEANKKRVLRSWLIFGTVVLAIAFVTGAFIYSNQPERYPPPPDEWSTIRPPYTILALAEQSDVIWAGGADGIFAIDRQTGFLSETVPELLSETRYVRDLCVDNHDMLWIAHNGGITRFLNGEVRTFTSKDGLLSGYCAAVMQDSKSNIWIGTETGIAKLEGDIWHDYTLEAGFGKIPITVIYEDQRGVMWFGSDSLNTVGLICYDGNRWTSYAVSTGTVAHNTITDILEDTEGNLWIASGLGSSGGATCISKSGIKLFNTDNGLMGPRARSIFQDSLGRIWLGSEFEGSAIFDKDKKYFLTPDLGLAGWEVMEMIEDSSGTIWIATENGITRIDSVDYVSGNLGNYSNE
jgi:ligand-binding sensor domain-containing protein